jgi:hypothetical protein
MALRNCRVPSVHEFDGRYAGGACRVYNGAYGNKDSEDCNARPAEVRRIRRVL